MGKSSSTLKFGQSADDSAQKLVRSKRNAAGAVAYVARFRIQSTNSQGSRVFIASSLTPSLEEVELLRNSFSKTKPFGKQISLRVVKKSVFFCLATKLLIRDFFLVYFIKFPQPSTVLAFRPTGRLIKRKTNGNYLHVVLSCFVV